MSSNKESIFRSAEMSLVQFYIASEIARDMVSVFGEIGNIQFRDLNANINSFQRSFVKEIRKFNDTERQLRYLQSTIDKQEIKIPITIHDYAKIPISSIGEAYSNGYTSSQVDDLVSIINQYESNIRSMDQAYEGLISNKYDLIENRLVLTGTRSFFQGRLSLELIDEASQINQLRRNSLNSDDQFLISDDEDGSIEIFNRNNRNLENNNADGTGPTTNELNIMGSTMNFLTGTIDREKYFTLQKILWRSLRGNLYINYIPIEEKIYDKKKNEFGDKYIFLVFTHGEVLMKRSRKIIESLDGHLFDILNDEAVVRQQLNEINSKISDLNQVLDHTKERLLLELKEIATNIEKWRIDIKKEKSIYVILNNFNYDQTRRCLIAEGWIPKNDLDLIKTILRDITERSQTDINSVVNELQTNKIPPTYHKTNKLTSSFQMIIDAYGIATYQEVNPALASVVTFPFMFAIMFGDVGHGIILFIAAFILVMKEKVIGAMRNRDEIFDMAYTGRYILLLMGAFSIFTGFMYNDIFSRSMTFFKSGWKWPENFEEGDTILGTHVGTYPIGLDPAWHGAENNLLFTNSYKMKLSILMGFAHMTYSFMLSLVNYRFFKSRVDIIGNFLPGLLFMQSIFGYLSLTIIYKWTVDWIGIEKPAPSLLNMLINMFLSPGTVDEKLYPGQAVIQVILIVIALVCVPWLLLYKPLTLKKQNQKSIALGYADLNEHHHAEQLRQSIDTNFEIDDEDNHATSTANTATNANNSTGGAANTTANANEDFFIITDFDEPTEEFNFGDVMIHQVIHTIEFCLNCVSHTASYLRLWALSLAHNQLSAVLWDMTISNSFVSYKDKGFVGILMVFFLFGMWFVLTVCVLVVMEGTSAMLHSLRLHWVEAMSKFFEGEGYAYDPFSFEAIFDEKDD
ncbi:hypothetical protein BVG19_g226 [[Candida] boidinii]|nr:hypothetical protein BVG19_g226 [[Candida] boidinii]OWB49789.1 hypothetical protein B5S27_g1333 [[Candida] boidinii]